MENNILERLATGIFGLDEILNGGLIARRAYLLRGGPGNGKTMIGLHFLTTGIINNENTLYINLGESEEQIRNNANILGFNLAKVEFLDLSPTSDYFAERQSYDIFSPTEVERQPVTQQIIETIESFSPKRVFLDSLTQFRYLSTDSFQYRKQVLSFLRYIIEKGATVLFTSESTSENPDDDLQFICDGIIQLNRTAQGRTMSVNKFRGSDFIQGEHTMKLTDKGVEVFPTLKPDIYKRDFKPEILSSGLPPLDNLLNGGLERGSITILRGPSGVGKTTVGLQFLRESAGRKERSVLYTFEESIEMLLNRCESLMIPAKEMIHSGKLSIVHVEPLHFTADEFAQMVRAEVEYEDTRMVMIDSVAGFRLSLVSGEDLVKNLHALCKYLQNMGIAVLLINENESISNEFQNSEIGLNFLADNLIYIRFVEKQSEGRVELRKIIGVLKKRMSDFEKSIREIELTRTGIKIGLPISNVHGLLSGNLEWKEKQ